MIRMLGAILLSSGAAGVGILSALSVRRTLQLLRELQTTLELMQTEIRFHLLPVSELFGLCAESCRTKLGGIFSHAERLMELDPACTPVQAMQHTDAEILLPEEGAQILYALCRSLGQSDVEGQVQAVGLAQARLAGLLDRFEREQPGRCKSYCALGVSAGLALVILLI